MKFLLKFTFCVEDLQSNFWNKVNQTETFYKYSQTNGSRSKRSNNIKRFYSTKFNDLINLKKVKIDNERNEINLIKKAQNQNNKMIKQQFNKQLKSKLQDQKLSNKLKINNLHKNKWFTLKERKQKFILKLKRKKKLLIQNKKKNKKKEYADNLLIQQDIRNKEKEKLKQNFEDKIGLTFNMFSSLAPRYKLWISNYNKKQQIKREKIQSKFLRYYGKNKTI